MLEKPIPTISLSGTSKQIGQDFGEAFRDNIHAFAATRLKRSRQFVRMIMGKAVDETWILKQAKHLLTIHQHYDDDIWQEFSGISNGANIEPERLLVCMSYTDLRDYLCQHYDNETGECSAFMLPAHYSEQGVLCGQTWDMSPEAIDYLVMVKRQIKHQPTTLSLTTMGSLPLIGMNDVGLAIGNTNLAAKDSQVGVNYLFTITRALRETTLSNAKQCIIDTPRLSGHNFYISDAKHFINLETSAKQVSIDDNQKTTLCLTNHYRNSALHDIEAMHITKEGLQHSKDRLERMSLLFSDQENWTMQKCWQQLADDKKSPMGAAICNDANHSHNLFFKTVATCVLCPKERTLWVCKGGAKNKQPQKFNL